MVKKTLVIGDAHSAPNQDLRRFTWLGNYMAENHVDTFVQGGDWFTLDSCSYFPVPRLEKTTLKEDIEAGIEAIQLMMAPIVAERQRLRAGHRKIWRPTMAWLDGNHEERLERRCKDDEDILGSLINLWDLAGIRKQFDFLCGYRQYLTLDGIQYTHIPQNGLRRPMTGINRTRQIAQQTKIPTVFFHTHKMEYREVPVFGNHNETNWSLNCPCYMEWNHIEPYAEGGTTGWTYGGIELTHYPNGEVVHRHISMSEFETYS